jgi:hypothetical protein
MPTPGDDGVNLRVLASICAPVDDLCYEDLDYGYPFKASHRIDRPYSRLDTGQKAEAEVKSGGVGKPNSSKISPL